MKTENSISKRIRQIRESKNIARKQLAEYLNTTEQVVVNLELGRKKLDADTLYSLSEIFEMSMDEILGNTPELMSKKQAIKKLDPKGIIDRYYSLSDRSQNNVDRVIDQYISLEKKFENNYDRLTNSIKDFEVDPMLQAAHYDSNGKSQEEIQADLEHDKAYMEDYIKKHS